MKNKIAITLTEYEHPMHGAPSSIRATTLPVSRIAKVRGHPKPATVAECNAAPLPFQSTIMLRTPEEVIVVVETPEQIESLMNG